MPIPLLLAAGLAKGAYDIGSGLIERGKAKRELAKLKPVNYSVSPELQNAYSRAESMAGKGYTPAQSAKLEQDYARSSNTAYQHAVDTAPNMASAINAGINYGRPSFLNQKAFDDARLADTHTQYADSLAKNLQAQKNMASHEDINEYVRKATAFGNAGKIQGENISQGLNSMIMAGWMNQIYGGGGLGGKVPIGNTNPTGGSTQVTGLTNANPNNLYAPSGNMPSLPSYFNNPTYQMSPQQMGGGSMLPQQQEYDPQSAWLNNYGRSLYMRT
jgi:hypothetical protein